LKHRLSFLKTFWTNKNWNLFKRKPGTRDEAVIIPEMISRPVGVSSGWGPVFDELSQKK